MTKQSNQMSPRFFFFYLGRFEISNGYTNKATAEVTESFDGVEEVSAQQKEGIVNYNYSKERYIGGLADRLWKVTLVPVTTWHMPYAQYDRIYGLPEESHYFSYLPVERATRHPSPATGYSLSVTRYPVPAIRHPLPSTRYPSPATRHPSPATRHRLPATRHPLPATRGKVLPQLSW